MALGKLAQAKQKRQEKFNNEFISLFDSVLYLGEPLDEALEYIIECMPQQSKLHLTNDGCQSVYLDNSLYGERHNAIWTFGEHEIYNNEIIENLSECIKQKYIETTNPIYNLGFGKKRFLNYLVADGIEVNPKDLETAISPTPIFDEYREWDSVDYYTIQSIIDERDELRQLVDELKKQGKPKQITPQGDNLLILGAVIDTLANEKISPYTQKLLIDKILARLGKIKGISESTLTKKFAESKDYIKRENEILL